MNTLKSISANVAISLTILLCTIGCAFAFIPFKPGLVQASDVTTKHPLSVPEIAARALPSVARLTVRGSDGQPYAQGSGFVIGKNLIVTNVHVIAGAHSVTANYLDGRSEEVFGVVALDGDRDLAILYTDTKSAKPLSLADISLAHVGDSVVALGSPKGYEGSVSSGIISAFRNEDGINFIQTTAPISHGSSGGPLLNMYGEVLGVTSLMDPDGENLNFAYSSTYLKSLLPAKITSYTTWKDLEPEWKKNPPDQSQDPQSAQPQNSPNSTPSQSQEPPPSAPQTPGPATAPQAPPPNGAKVWVNTSTKVFHYPGSRWYGKTKNGKYMDEADAIAAGYHAAEHEKK
jgi:S1-C subfamily serine protease